MLYNASNGSNAKYNQLDLSKATPAFKKTTNELFKLFSNATSNTLNSNEERY